MSSLSLAFTPQSSTEASAVNTILELFDECGGSLHPGLYVACQHYSHRHTPAVIAHKRHQEEDNLTDEAFRQLPLATRIHVIFETPLRHRFGKAFVAFQVVMSLATLLAVLLESLPQYNGDITPSQAETWSKFDGFLSNYFLVELLVRIIVHPPPRRRLFTSFTIYIQVLSALPFYFTLILEPTKRHVIGLLKGLRLLRLASLLSRIGIFETIILASRRSVKTLITPLAAVACLSLFLASALYHAEKGAYDPVSKVFKMRDCVCEATSAFVLGKKKCPHVESHYYSTIHALWNILETVTTVGYGDLIPLCSYGKFVLSLAMVVGIFGLALPVAILGYHFASLEETTRSRRRLLRRSASGTGSGKKLPTTSGGDGRDTDDTSSHGSSPSLQRTRSRWQVKRHGDGESEATAWLLHQRYLSPAWKLIDLLHRNTGRHHACGKDGSSVAAGGAASPQSRLQRVNLYAPDAELIFFVDIFLSDFAEELASRSRSVTHRGRTVADLVPLVTDTTHSYNSSGNAQQTASQLHQRKVLRLADVPDCLRLDIFQFDRVADLLNRPDEDAKLASLGRVAGGSRHPWDGEAALGCYTRQVVARVEIWAPGVAPTVHSMTSVVGDANRMADTSGSGRLGPLSGVRGADSDSDGDASPRRIGARSQTVFVSLSDRYVSSESRSLITEPLSVRSPATTTGISATTSSAQTHQSLIADLGAADSVRDTILSRVAFSSLSRDDPVVLGNQLTNNGPRSPDGSLPAAGEGAESAASNAFLGKRRIFAETTLDIPVWQPVSASATGKGSRLQSHNSASTDVRSMVTLTYRVDDDDIARAVYSFQCAIAIFKSRQRGKYDLGRDDADVLERFVDESKRPRRPGEDKAGLAAPLLDGSGVRNREDLADAQAVAAALSPSGCRHVPPVRKAAAFDWRLMGRSDSAAGSSPLSRWRGDERGGNLSPGMRQRRGSPPQ